MPGVKGRSGGRNAKTIQQHQLEGTFNTTRHSGFENPDPTAGTPKPPKALSAEARLEWKRMIGRLTESKTLSIVDDAALYQYVQLFAETEGLRADAAKTRALSAELKKTARELEGAELVTAIAEIVKLQFILAKLTTQLRQGHMAVRQYLVEFGLTPAARSRVRTQAGAEEKADPFDEFQKQGGIRRIK